VPDAAATPESAVLASLVGWPGARVRYDPVPLGLGIGERPVWLAGALAWDDAPEEVALRLDLGTACEVHAVEIVPFLRTERREVFEVEALGVVRRLRGVDGTPMHVRAPPVRLRSVEVRVRSMVGEAFALWNVRVLGDRATCTEPWAPVPGAVGPSPMGVEVTLGDLLRLSARYPHDARAAVGAARRLVAAGSTADAEALLRTALGRDRRATPAWLELGLLLDSVGRFDEAFAAYRSALAADSNSAWARGCVAWAELRRSKPLRALYQSWRASRLDARYADAFTIMAGALRQLGWRSRARELLAHAIDLDPQRSWAYLELAQLHEDSGRSDAAVEVLRRLLALAPQDEQARAMVVRLTGKPPGAPST
jgi:Flp pilus assembly protein TadD